MIEVLPLGIYVHLPWCVRKCPYCDFNSHALKGQLPERAYLEALLADLEIEAQGLHGRVARSVFFGGGTPSLFSPGGIGRIICAIGDAGLLAQDAEISMEANPGTIERGQFAEYLAVGVNRFSLGVQTFNPEHLERIGRIHSDREIWKSVNELAAAGIGNFNLDLMYALPGQSVSQALQDIRLAADANPAHISHYQLTIEPNTPFHHKPPSLPGDDDAWQMQTEGQELLAATGFRQYEVSAYARPGRECRHNLNYWTYGDYVGIGAGAHGKLTDSATGQISRYFKSKHPRRYVDSAGKSSRNAQVLTSADIAFEFMLNNLRLRDGFAESDFEARTGLSFSTVLQSIRDAVRHGLLEGDERGCWRSTTLGFRFLNDLQACFLPPAPEKNRGKYSRLAGVTPSL
jgi:oxygen-independent coproporphyrinogen-3 oxidase